MDTLLAVIAAVAATVFTLDLVRDLVRRPRPHVAAYAVGIGMFAIATWALVYGLANGWSGLPYRIFFLFGAVLNIPFLALGSMYLVIGKRSGTVMTLVLGGLSAISITLVSTVAFERELPASGVPTDIFAPLTDGFGPRFLALIGASGGATILVALALVSLIRFWRANRGIVYGNGLILTGTLVAAWGGAQLALGDDTLFTTSLLITSIFLWAGYRIAKEARVGTRRGKRPLVFLLGPSIQAADRPRTEMLIQRLESLGYDVFCPPRDIEDWGANVLGPAAYMQDVFATIEKSDALLVDLTNGYGVVATGYAVARRIPVVMAAPEGHGIPGPLRGIADAEIYYGTPDDIASRFAAAFALEE